MIEAAALRLAHSRDDAADRPTISRVSFWRDFSALSVIDQRHVVALVGALARLRARPDSNSVEGHRATSESSGPPLPRRAAFAQSSETMRPSLAPTHPSSLHPRHP